VAAAFGLVAAQSQNSAAQSEQPKPAAIDGERAYGYLKKLCDFGSRKAGSVANASQRKYVADHFTACGATLTEQKFKGRDYLDPRRPVNVEMVNLVGSWFPERADRVVIAAHYDTRPFPDRDPDPARQRAAFVGANDGASGVAVLMEIANHLKKMETPWGVDLVLFDGEELVYQSEKPAKISDYFLGSREFSKHYKARKKAGPGSYRYHAGFVLDMVGDKDLAIAKEPRSLHLPGAFLVPQIWQIAAQLEATGFVNEVGDIEVQDDHLPMNDVGIPTIDIIDFKYAQWHTADDLPEYCSADSLKQVGRVMTAWLNLPKPKPKRK
jgi:hypothetical protein